MKAVFRSAAIRAAVARCVELVGRPVSRREFRWWVVAGGAPELPLRTLAKDLDQTAQSDRRAVAGGAVPDGRLERIEGDLTAFGAAPVRFAVPPFDYERRLACLVEDACLGLRLEQELAGIARLRRHAERRRSPALAHFASVREGLLQNAFDRLTLRLTWEDRRAAIDTLRSALEKLDLFVLEGAGATAGGDNLRREIARRRRELDALAGWQVPDDRGALEGRAIRWRLLGVPTVTLQPYLAATELDLGQPVAWHKLLYGVRRVPTPKDVPIAQPGQGGGPPSILVDRVDALLALYRRVPVARANALLSSADGLLGRVVRDPDMVRACLREAVAHGDSTTRRAALVSLGLLGDLDEDDLPLIGGDEMPDIAAILLAINISRPEECEAWIGRLRKQLRHYEALRLTETAQLCVQRGRLISAIG